MAGEDLGNFTAMRFPENLGTEENPYFITFRPQKVDYGKSKNLSAVRDLASNLISATGQQGVVDDFFGKVNEKVGGVVDNISKKAKDSLSDLGGVFGVEAGSLESRATALGKIVKGKIKIGDFILSSGIFTDQDRLFDVGSISLYMPEGLQSGMSIDFGAQEVGAGVDALRKQVGDVSGGASAIDKIKDADTGKLSKAFIGDALRQSQAAKNLTALTANEVANPFSYQIFNGVQHRSFKYAFKMVAKSPQESKHIKTICDLFLYWSLPGRTEDDATFLEIPCQWKIEYKKFDKDLEFYEIPRSCFLTDVSVNYNNDAQNALHLDGAPIAVDLELSFVEIEPLFRDKSKSTADKIDKISSGVKKLSNLKDKLK